MNTRPDRKLDGWTLLALSVLAVATFALSYVHMTELALAEPTLADDPLTVYGWPVAADVMTIAASLELVRAARRRERAGFFARVALLSGVSLSLWANIAAGGSSLPAQIMSGSTALAFALTLEVVLRKRVLEGEPVEVTLGRGVLLTAEIREQLAGLGELRAAVNAEAPEPVNAEEPEPVNGRRRVNGRRPVNGRSNRERSRVAAENADKRARVTAAIRERGTGVSRRGLADELGVAPSYVTKLVRQLEEASS